LAEAMQFDIEIRVIDSIRPYEKNPRKNDSAVDAVAASLQEFGFRQPIVVDGDGVIIAGHTRYKAAQKLGLAKVPVHVATDLSPEQIRAYRLADNKTGELATWDLEILPIELSALQEAGYELDVLAFDDKELANLLDTSVQQRLTDPDQVPEPPDEAVTKKGDIWVLGDHRLMCGDSSSAKDVDRLLDGATIQLCNTDPPYNVKVEPRSNNAIAAGLSSFTNTHHQNFDVERHPEKADATHKKLRPKDRPLENDFVSDEEFDRLLDAWFGNIARVLEPGRAFYIWGGYANLGNYPPMLKQHDLYFSQGIVWDKQHPVLTRKDFMGAFELCQPPDTQVRTPSGTTRIASLRDGDEVAAFAPRSWAIVGHRSGPAVKVGTRQYGGPLYGVSVERNTTWCTDGHLFSVRLVHNAPSIWCVYLMRRGRWWRVGKTKLLTTWRLGLKQRLDMEDGEEAWILSTHNSNSEATCAEQVVSARYGIPTTFWAETSTSKRTESQIARIYDQIDPIALHRGALWALSDHDRRLEHPFIWKGRTRAKYGRRVSFLSRACNLLPGAMEVPLPTSGPGFRWAPIRHIDVQPYSGPVYSLDVKKYRHYIADGIVTHNCFYGWRLGAGHKFFGPNNAKDLWAVKKVNPQSMIHLTEKPTELAVRAIQYSSKPGENVLELFGGSGSTLIACEQTGRRCYAMELDELYCDVICERYAQFSGQPPVRESDGAEWSRLRAA
jgi:DNA modification methylase